ncbi:MAG: UDP-2,3-diacylglucosamine diphosphatase [Burkholderiaceae bacterium]|nr:UDP-2,3-diacylglucosamine diphosphatase [Burkholderiaceae bacterium]
MPPQTASQPQEFIAPANWSAVDFISDLHMQASEPETFEAWRRYLSGTPADAVFMLGDLFEVWVGDDAARVPDSFEARCATVMREAAQRRPLFFMHGNRDFLLGAEFLASAAMTVLPDPCTLVFAGERWLLSHGDALCLDDTDYQAFRAQVRSLQWQQAFLSRPLTERQAVARGLREQSQARKSQGMQHADVDAPMARSWLQAARCATLIHGHTHLPAEHALGAGLRRVVLSDWDALARPPRMQVLRLDAGGLRRIGLA